jgi:hypothetical protein
MYRSKRQIEKRLEQVKYTHGLIRRFKGVLLSNNGIDPITGARPLIVHLSALLAEGRSVIQYAWKEAKETGRLAAYDGFVKQSEIFKLFTRLRNRDIHEYTVAMQTTAYATLWVAPDSSPQANEPSSLDGETLPGPSMCARTRTEAKVVHTILERVETSEALVEELERNGQVELLQAAKSGEELYVKIAFEGNEDLHDICDLHVTELETFVAYGQANGFIS